MPERVMTPESEKYAKIGKFVVALKPVTHLLFIILDMGFVERV